MPRPAQPSSRRCMTSFLTSLSRMASAGNRLHAVEVVDFIIHSVEYDAPRRVREWTGRKDSTSYDPFTGTGTFLVRLLQSGLIPSEKLLQQIQTRAARQRDRGCSRTNIAASTSKDLHGLRVAKARTTTCVRRHLLTDTFSSMNPANKLRRHLPETPPRKTPETSPIRVVIANPPYSVGQESANDTNQNIHYPVLDNRIAETSAARSTATTRTVL